MSDDRLKKNSGASRQSRAAETDTTRAAQQTEVLSSEERRRAFRNEWTQEALPAAPEIPGFHTCWLSTTNSYDPIHKRLRMGYEPVKVEELPGFEAYHMKAGEHTGYVGCNEMILYKIPEYIYQEIMTELHHNAPLDEQDKLRVQLENLQGKKDSAGKQLLTTEGEGMTFEQSVPAPHFQ